MFRLHIAKDNSLITVPGMNRERRGEQTYSICKVNHTPNILILVSNQYGQSDLNYTKTLKKKKACAGKYIFCARE